MKELSYLSRPGIGYLDEDIIINIITQEFKFNDTKWVTSRCRKTEQKIARQLLMTCLIDHLKFGLRRAGEVCMRDHATAYHSSYVIREVFWNDAEYGSVIRRIYQYCDELKPINNALIPITSWKHS